MDENKKDTKYVELECECAECKERKKVLAYLLEGVDFYEVNKTLVMATELFNLLSNPKLKHRKEIEPFMFMLNDLIDAGFLEAKKMSETVLLNKKETEKPEEKILDNILLTNNTKKWN